MTDHPQDAVPSAPTQSPPSRVPMRYDPGSFNTLFWCFFGLFIGGLLLFIVYIGFFALLAAIVIQYIFLFKAWNQLQDGTARTSPGMAVGFMFIPFFNFYWLFVAFYGLSCNINRYMNKNNIDGPRCSEGLVLTTCILVLVTIIPIIGWIVALALIPMWLIVFNQFRKSSMAIAASG